MNENSIHFLRIVGKRGVIPQIGTRVNMLRRIFDPLVRFLFLSAGLCLLMAGTAWLLSQVYSADPWGYTYSLMIRWTLSTAIFLFTLALARVLGKLCKRQRMPWPTSMATPLIYLGGVGYTVMIAVIVLLTTNKSAAIAVLLIGTVATFFITAVIKPTAPVYADEPTTADPAPSTS